jgi:hypothetical protein
VRKPKGNPKFEISNLKPELPSRSRGSKIKSKKTLKDHERARKMKWLGTVVAVLPLERIYASKRFVVVHRGRTITLVAAKVLRPSTHCASTSSQQSPAVFGVTLNAPPIAGS